MSDVEFDEKSSVSKGRSFNEDKNEGWVVHLLQSMGVAKNKTEANIVMLILVIICFFIIIYTTIHYNSSHSHQRTMLPLAVSGLIKIYE